MARTTTMRTETAKSTQIKFRAPTPLSDLIEEAAKQNGWGVSEEIRRRLDASFAAAPQPTADPKTRQLLGAIAAVADFLTVQRGPVSEMLGLDPPLGPWHRDPVAFAALQKAIDRFLSLLAPGRKPEGQEIEASERLAAAAMGSSLSQLMTFFEPGAVIASGSFAGTKRQGSDQ